MPRCVDGLTASVANQFLTINVKFIAFGMSSEIVVIVEHQNACVSSDPLLVKKRRG